MKLPARFWMFFYAGLGGTALQWLEMASNPTVVNRYFFLGMLAASVVGMLGLIIFGNGTSTNKAAFGLGFSAPNMLSGLVNTGSNLIAGLSLGLGIVYADNHIDTMMPDTATMEINIQGTHQKVEIKDVNTGDIYIIDANTPEEIPYSDSLEISIDNIGKKSIGIDAYNVDSTRKMITVKVVKKHKIARFFGGFTPLHRNVQAPVNTKIKVFEIDEPKPKSDTTDTLDGEVSHE